MGKYIPQPDHEAGSRRIIICCFEIGSNEVQKIGLAVMNNPQK